MKQQYFVDWMWIPTLAGLAFLLLALLSALGVISWLGHGVFPLIVAVALLGVVTWNIFYNPEYRAKRGLPARGE